MYTVIPTEQFEKDVKYYIKKKGFKHIGEDIKVITDELEKGKQTKHRLHGGAFSRYKYVLTPD